MKFRRSRQSEKHDSGKPVQISIPQKDAIAIEPPKKVIKALYDYTAPADSDQCLSFSAGDFLHVVSREDDDQWYEACNPLKNERGLVPAQWFEEVGKFVRDSADTTKSASSTTHDSGYAENTTTTTTPTTRSVTSHEYAMSGHRTSKSVGRGVAGGIFGMVIYDFKAERPDELDAREGEAIIVIAQSNPEWFVAKPITRLGGPGLIPVSFIEIRDMSTGQPVADPLEAVQKAGIPKVEEWKKMAAEYKNTSIPLGTVSSSQQIQSIQQGLNRMSLTNGQQNGQSNAAMSYGAAPEQQQDQLGAGRASVPRYIFADDKFHFIVECKLSNGTHWDLSRIYEDFYYLQIALISAFPAEAGQVPGKPRILPYMPGPVQFVTDSITEGRRSSLNEYLRDLLRLQPHITNSTLVRNFFIPRQGDYEIDPNAVDLQEHAQADPPNNRYSATSHNSHPNGGSQQLQSQSAAAYQSNQGQGPNAYGHQRQQQSLQTNAQEQPRGHSRSPSGSNQQSQSQSQSHSAQPSVNASGTSLGSGPQVKVKAWFDRDTCVVLRMPPRGQFNYAQLIQRIVERRRLEYKGQDQNDENLDVEYRDGQDGEYYRLEGDEDLDIALERNEKLTLAVRTATK